MDAEVNEKEQKRNTVSVTIPNVPVSVHNKIKLYRRKLNAERQKDFNLMDAYAEFLKEATKAITA